MPHPERLFVQYGAGWSCPDGWMNFDASPTLRLERLPMLGGLMARLSGNGQPFPAGVRYGDILKGLGVPDGSVSGLYASHVLEHLSLADMWRALRNSFALLKPKGIFRLIVPDIHERARSYVAAADKGDPQAIHAFLRSTYLGKESRPRGLAGAARDALGNSAHLWMWDYAAMSAELKDAGFTSIRPAAPGDSGEPMFDRVEDVDRFFDGSIAEVAIHCEKP